MDLQEFRAIVDAYPNTISSTLDDLAQLYTFVGLPIESSLSRDRASEELYRKIKGSFSAGRQTVWRQCRDFGEELIQDHVLDGKPIKPYYEVLERLRDGVRGEDAAVGDVEGDWKAAIQHAVDHVRLRNWHTPEVRERLNPRPFELARAAKRLRDAGAVLNRQGHFLSLAPESEIRVVSRLEALIAQMGGLNVARRGFAQLAGIYDEVFERYHLVKRTSMSGGGKPQIPFGYIFLLAAKHFRGTKPRQDTDQNWAAILQLASDYAAIFDVQEYAPSAWRQMGPSELIVYLREVALYDTLFRLPQIRSSDIEPVLRGILRNLDFDKKRGGGWSLNELLAIMRAMLTASASKRGPHSFDARKIMALEPSLDKTTVRAAFDEVFSHAITGANRNFSKPTDAPTDQADGRRLGHDFYTRPLLTGDGKMFWLLDRAMCSTACLEAVLGAARNTENKLDQRLGETIETFLRETFHSHQVPTVSGDYDVDREHGECDIIVETKDVVIFFEIKKKPFTRRAQAGSDAHVLVDLAESVVAAQAQAGWHEVRLRKHGFIDLVENGARYRLDLKGRSVERVAVSLLQYGSFQDRIFLKQLLEAIMNASFSSPDSSLNAKMTKLNGSLAELREQIAALYPGDTPLRMPYFHCWFLSVPQLLVLFDCVSGPEGFKGALWRTRGLASSSADFYHDLSFMSGSRV